MSAIETFVCALLSAVAISYRLTQHTLHVCLIPCPPHPNVCMQRWGFVMVFTWCLDRLMTSDNGADSTAWRCRVIKNCKCSTLFFLDFRSVGLGVDFWPECCGFNFTPMCRSTAQQSTKQVLPMQYCRQWYAHVMGTGARKCPWHSCSSSHLDWQTGQSCLE